jgi:hypothetical protein
MTNELQHAAPLRLRHGHFSEGLDDRLHFPEDERVGRFSRGLERVALDEKRHRHGRFSKGEEALPEEDPEKDVERRFSEGLEGRVLTLVRRTGADRRR